MPNGPGPPPPPERPDFRDIFERMEARLGGLPPPPPPVDYGPYYTPPPPVDYGPYYAPPASQPYYPAPPIPGPETPQRIPWRHPEPPPGQGMYPLPSFWQWLEGSGYRIAPESLRRAQEGQPTIDTTEPEGSLFWSGAYWPSTKEIVSRWPLKGPWLHELGHHMDPGVYRSPAWQKAVRRWATDAEYPSGEWMWEMITRHPPGASEENPGWGEAYARAAKLPWPSLPPYIQEVLFWRLPEPQSTYDIEDWRKQGVMARYPPMTEEKRRWLDEAYAKMDAELRGRRIQGIR